MSDWTAYLSIILRASGLFLVAVKVFPQVWKEFKRGGALSYFRLMLLLLTVIVVVTAIVPSAYQVCRLFGCASPLFLDAVSVTNSVTYFLTAYVLFAIYRDSKKP